MKKLVLCIGVLCMVLSIHTPIFAQSTNLGQGVIFSDVPTNHWAWKEIQYSVSQNIVSGNGNGTFLPDAGVTREQFCRMLTSTFNAPLSNSGEQSFNDVSPTKWSYPYIETSKEFLTGYANPFGGYPNFKPEEYATREDIAVSLVRMMGLTDRDVEDTYYVQEYFSDYENISPQLINYINLACERGLISGYPDGSLRPTKGMTRAETVALLNRATKQAVTNMNEDLLLSTNTVYDSTGKTGTIYVKAEEGTTVTVDGKPILMESNGNGAYEGVFVYTFESEGEKNVTLKGMKAGKTKSMQVTLAYKIGTPKLNILQCPTTAITKQITISGTLTDDKHEKTLTINGENVSVDYNGRWEKTVTLKEGENKYTFIATNEAGKSVTVEKTVVFNIGGPQLTVLRCPTTATTKQVTMNGTLKDSNYEVLLTINGENERVDYAGNWEKTVTLKEGENKYSFVAKNTAGKTVTEEKTIVFNIGGPQLTVLRCPTTATTKQVTINGTLKDSNYEVLLTINGENVRVDYAGNWEKTVTLKEGENKYSFVATNTAGKTVTEEKTVVFNIGGPQLTVVRCPTTAITKEVTINGTLKDSNYEVLLTINGENVRVDYAGNWEKTVKLLDGMNHYTFVATNTAGKTVTEERTIEFSAGSPKIHFTSCPKVAQKKYIIVEGDVSGFTDGLKFYANDQKILMNYDNSFSVTLSLDEGENALIFRAINSYGKEDSVMKTITYISEVKAPELDVNDIPSITENDTVTLSGNVRDSLNSNVEISINNEEISNRNGDFSKTLTLTEGNNTIVVTATNSYGKTTTVAKNITYTAPTPLE